MEKPWKVAIIKDTATPMLGLHGLHTAFRGLPGVEVVAQVDSRVENLEEKLRYTQARRHYLTCREMLARETPHIVVICSRHPDDHLPQIQAAAEKGCHIYCEKPLATTLEEADRIVELAERHRIKIAMAHPARHAVAFQTMKTLVEAGKIGEPLTVHGQGKCDHRGGGEDLVVLGTHILDLMIHFFGQPTHVSAEVTAEGRPVTRADRNPTVEPIGPAAGDRIFAHIGFPHGVRGIFESRKGLYDPATGHPRMGLTVIGTKGALSLRFDDIREQPLLIGPPEQGAPYEEVPLPEHRDPSGAEPLDYTLPGQPDIPRSPMFLKSNRLAAWDLLQAIQEDRAPLASITDARTVLELIQGIYASHLQGGRRVRLPLEDRAHPLAGGG
jgi:predicted dehydrogenase